MNYLFIYLFILFYGRKIVQKKKKKKRRDQEKIKKKKKNKKSRKEEILLGITHFNLLNGYKLNKNSRYDKI